MSKLPEDTIRRLFKKKARELGCDTLPLASSGEIQENVYTVMDRILQKISKISVESAETEGRKIVEPRDIERALESFSTIVSNQNGALEKQELTQAMKEGRARIVAVGCGGAGGNTISRMMKVGIQGAETIAINTDAQDLLYVNANRKILIGREITGGLGAGNDPSKGEKAAQENKNEIKEHLADADLVLVTCGLGGGTGTGASPVVAKIAKQLGALTTAVVTLPFSVEGMRRRRNAEIGLKKLREITDTVIVILNDKLLEVTPDLPISAAFKVADKLLMDSIKGITELITKPGLINLDFADVSTVLEGNGVAMIGIGESDAETRAADAANEALNSPLLDVDVTGASGALVNVTGGPDMSLDEAESIVGRVSEALDPEAQITWGAQISDDMKKTVRVMLILSGIHSSSVDSLGKGIPSKQREKVKEEIKLRLDYLE